MCSIRDSISLEIGFSDLKTCAIFSLLSHFCAYNARGEPLASCSGSLAFTLPSYSLTF